MAHPLDSCRVKINRASEHIQYLDSAVRAFLDSSYGVTRDRNPDTGDIEYRVRNSANRETITRFAVIAGEVIHHLRSSLDHLAWQLVKANGHPHPDIFKPRVEFPVFVDREKYMSHGAGKIKAAGEEAAKAVERLQPYNRGDEFKTDPLWIIHYLDIVDKHKLLPIIVNAIDVERPEGVEWKLLLYHSEVAMTFVPEQPMGVIPIGRYRRFDMQDGAVIFSAPPAYMDVDFKFRFEVVLGNIGALRHQSIVITLQNLRDSTVKIINQFVRLF